MQMNWVISVLCPSVLFIIYINVSARVLKHTHTHTVYTYIIIIQAFGRIILQIN